jgi:hypothetical protein
MSCRNLWQQIDADTPKPSKRWLDLDVSDRLLEIQLILSKSNCSGYLEVESCTDDGDIYFSQVIPIETSQRVDLLVSLEELLQEKIDQSVTVWIKPQSDKNSLRRLRGVELKSL